MSMATTTKVCKGCVSFPQDTARGPGWPPRILVHDVVALPPRPHKSLPGRLRGLRRNVRLVFYGPPTTPLRCLLDTGSDFSCMPAALLNAVGARPVVRTLSAGATVRVATPHGPRRVRMGRYKVLWEVDVGLARTRLFRLAVEQDPDPLAQEGILGRDALAHFPVLLEPSADAPTTHIPASVQ